MGEMRILKRKSYRFPLKPINLISNPTPKTNTSFIKVNINRLCLRCQFVTVLLPNLFKNEIGAGHRPKA